MIQKELKEHTWVFEPDIKELTIWQEDQGIHKHISLDKVRMYSLFRFILRCTDQLRMAETKKWRAKYKLLKEKK